MVPVDAAEMKRMKHELGDVDMETAFLESKAVEVEKGRSRLQKMRISVKEQQESLIKEQEELETELRAIAASEQRITALQTSLRSTSLESSEVDGGGEGEEKRKNEGSTSGDVSLQHVLDLCVGYHKIFCQSYLTSNLTCNKLFHATLCFFFFFFFFLFTNTHRRQSHRNLTPRENCFMSCCPRWHICLSIATPGIMITVSFALLAAAGRKQRVKFKRIELLKHFTMFSVMVMIW
jgi:hypothetical protein